MAVDLHTHSTASDGSDDPDQLIEAAAGAGLAAIALTDHDTLAGIPSAAAAADRLGVELVPGVELSVTWEVGRLHLLVYFLEPGPGPLQDRLDDLLQGRHQRNRLMVDALQQEGIDITYQEVLTEAGQGAVGRPHFAAVLVRKGVVPDPATAFDRYLADGRPAYRPRLALSLTDAVGLAKASAAVPVAAHPHTMASRAEEFENAFQELAGAGVVGVECYYGEYDQATRSHLARLADAVGMIATGGSDYHGTYKPDIALGTGFGDLEVPDSALDGLRNARNSLL